MPSSYSKSQIAIPNRLPNPSEGDSTTGEWAVGTIKGFLGCLQISCRLQTLFGHLPISAPFASARRLSEV